MEPSNVALGARAPSSAAPASMQPSSNRQYNKHKSTESMEKKKKN
jgi:hypothetical protein